MVGDFMGGQFTEKRRVASLKGLVANSKWLVGKGSHNMEQTIILY